MIEVEQNVVSMPLRRGQCWHAMFRNPTIVKGYPIMARTEYNTGLELPFNIMARLAGVEKVNEFLGCTWLKSYNTLVAPTSQDGLIISWHFHQSIGDSRISYLDPEVGMYLSPDQIQYSRHVLGWCHEADFRAGKDVYLTSPAPTHDTKSSLTPGM
jgi:hypothetical protein